MVLIPIISALWIALKAGIEIYKTARDYKTGRYVEESKAHSHQHYAILVIYLVYGLAVPTQIIIGGFVFSPEWIPLNAFLDLGILYGIEHFTIERGCRADVIRFRDLFSIRWPKKIKHKNHI